jgi:hypothetical protein
MSTQFDSSPDLSSEVGAAIVLADGATDALAAELAATDAGAAELAEASGAAVPPAPVEHADAMNALDATSQSARFRSPVTVSSSMVATPRRKAHLYHL